MTLEATASGASTIRAHSDDLNTPALERVEIQLRARVHRKRQTAREASPVRRSLSIRDAAAYKGFDAVRAQAHRTWEQWLDRIEIEGGTVEQQQLFYSCLYYALIKPASFCDDSPGGLGPWFYDFATMWDLYKTQLPLVMMLDAERGAEIVHAMLAIGEREGFLPIGYAMDDKPGRFDSQARALMVYSIVDAFDRGLPGVDWQRALDVMLGDLRRSKNERFFREGRLGNRENTHVLDLAGACHAVLRMARALGRGDDAADLIVPANFWRNVIDADTGLLVDGDYYEGSKHNYSFRLQPEMRKRIGLAGGDDAFIRLLRSFFGYGAEPVRQPGVEVSPEEIQAGMALGRFEGLNNEPDMAAPYACLYAGRPDMTQEIVRAALAHQFAPGMGGLPGNDDSGALCSWFVWSAMGIFPVVGQAELLIGSGLFERVRIRGNDSFELHWLGATDNPYVTAASLDGQPHPRTFLSYEELRQHRRLELRRGSAPGSWGTAAKARPGS